MRYLAAYLLAQLGGTSRPQESDIKNILSSVGIECEQARAKLVVDQLHGKNVHDLINAGKEKMSTVSFGAAPVAVATPAGGAPTTAAAAEAPKGGDKAPAPAKEEKKEESEESDADMGFSLFD
ncbi:60S acidic ribosomal protein P2 [Echinococcus granulosus]|uniref:Large ribosomal subunit protein P2 n=1 Tax=Echinococcus granulosus TaxID=6210 RepID=A0A068X2P0_ECHGR|nr:60S acidic ribosomal protein P2 [Echinococcus granulosus]CDS24250.1 60S acidic ribosomal protein P2 [Echinococcus granulosus]